MTEYLKIGFKSFEKRPALFGGILAGILLTPPAFVQANFAGA
jgi:hypothetical protein